MTLREIRLVVSLAIVVASFAGARRVDAAQSGSHGEPVVYSGPAGVRCDQAGRIFVADDLSHRIVVTSPTGPARIFGGYGNQPGRLLYADAVHWRRDGRLLVADTGANRIQVWTPEGRFASQFGRAPKGVDRGKHLFGLLAPILILGGLAAFALRTAGLLQSVETVLVSIALGVASFLIWVVLSALFPPSLTNPRDIWVDADDQAYVADFGSDVVRVFDADNRLVRTIGRPGDGPGELRRPLGVVIDAAGHVLVTDSGNHRVQVFTKTGDFMATFGGEGSQAGRFRSPHGITVGPNGWLFVADRDNHRVQILRSEGSPIAVIDHATDGSGFIPLGLCFTPEGDLVASDSKGHRLLRWPAGWIRERAISGYPLKLREGPGD